MVLPKVSFLLLLGVLAISGTLAIDADIRRAPTFQALLKIAQKEQPKMDERTSEIADRVHKYALTDLESIQRDGQALLDKMKGSDPTCDQTNKLKVYMSEREDILNNLLKKEVNDIVTEVNNDPSIKVASERLKYNVDWLNRKVENCPVCNLDFLGLIAMKENMHADRMNYLDRLYVLENQYTRGMFDNYKMRLLAAEFTSCNRQNPAEGKPTEPGNGQAEGQS